MINSYYARKVEWVIKFDWAELTKQPVAFVLGAGASMSCFEFPGWTALKDDLLALDCRSFLSEIEEIDCASIQSYCSAFDEFRVLSESADGDQTLDALLYEMDKPKEKHRLPTAGYVMSIVGRLLSSHEQRIAAAPPDENWVTKFQRVIQRELSLAPSDHNGDARNRLLENFDIISLNYDRVFEHFFSHKFWQGLYDEPFDFSFDHAGTAIEITNRLRLNTYKPHGFIAMLPVASKPPGLRDDLLVSQVSGGGTREPGNMHPVVFGGDKLATLEIFERMGKHMYAVDETGQSQYQRANSALREARTVFLLGLSSEGITQSQMRIGAETTVYVTNAEEDTSKISAHFENASVHRLSSTPSRFALSGFAELFAKND